MIRPDSDKLKPRIIMCEVKPRVLYISRYLAFLKLLVQIADKHKDREWFHLREIYNCADAQKASTDAVNLEKWDFVERGRPCNEQASGMYRLTRYGREFYDDELAAAPWCITVRNEVDEWSDERFFMKDISV
jgi:hypothetical protein